MRDKTFDGKPWRELKQIDRGAVDRSQAYYGLAIHVVPSRSSVITSHGQYFYTLITDENCPLIRIGGANLKAELLGHHKNSYLWMLWSVTHPPLDLLIQNQLKVFILWKCTLTKV
ncbi:hypothetical protein TNCV_277761 [Trichonephila clavipes]|nr:hypothetical protein TNCV_277761 [Trichonephila clavipes]